MKYRHNAGWLPVDNLSLIHISPGQSVGDPLWGYYGYVCDGIFQNEEEIKNHPTQSMGTPVPGDLKYRDLNGDKVDVYKRQGQDISRNISISRQTIFVLPIVHH